MNLILTIALSRHWSGFWFDVYCRQAMNPVQAKDKVGSSALKLIVPFGVVVVVVALWTAAISLFHISPVLLPAPTHALNAVWELAGDGTLLLHVAVSLRRLIGGYCLAVASALPLAFLMSQSGWAKHIFNPVLEFLRQIPPLAMMPLLILWLGIGETQKIGIIVLACFFPVFIGTLGGIAQCDPKLKEVGRVYGLTGGQIVQRIVLPAALPSVVVGLRIALGQSWRALVGAELVASSAGLGYMIVDAENLARTDIVVAGIVVIGLLGLGSDWLARWLIGRFAPWVRMEQGTSDA